MNPIWYAFVVGVVVGGCFGIVILAIFQINTERKFKRFITREE